MKETITTRIGGYEEIQNVRKAVQQNGEIIYHGWAWKVERVFSTKNGNAVTMSRELPDLTEVGLGVRLPTRTVSPL